MNTSELIDQLLKSGSALLQKASATETETASADASEPASGILSDGNVLGGAGGKMLAGGVMGLLLGNQKIRERSGQLPLYDGLSALGDAAHRAYRSYQRDHARAPQGAPQTVDRLQDTQAEQHSEAILLAILGAAKADGHLDEEKRKLIVREIELLTGDEDLALWFDQELRAPLHAADVAKAASTPEMAAEMYLASLCVIDRESIRESTYLTELARELSLEPGLVRALEIQARQSRA